MKVKKHFLAVALSALAACAASAAPEVWLEFMGGNVRKDGLRCDLEAIKDAGFSGVHFFHISRGGAWPECPEQIPCMSEKWGEVVQFLGDECARLGLALTVQNCPGWSQSGGPWIDLDHCMRDIECVRADFIGGETVKIPDVPEKFRGVDSDWRDICVLAFPTPFSDVDGARIVDLTGVSDWKAPFGKWTVLRFGHVNAKRVNAPAPKEATGWECDKLDPKGIEANFKGYIRKLLDGSLKGRMHGMLVDSWECFGQTWTARMEEYFRNANGYDLRKHLPSIFGFVIDSPEATERFLTDWRRTNGDLITKNYYGRMAELAHEAGLEVYYETAFGDIICGDLLEYWKYSDAPMCEFWHPHDAKDKGGVGTYAFKSVRPCASAAHIYGKKRVVAEAFTGWGIRWDEDFKRLQDTANRHFARGVTHLAYQSYTHAPSPTATPPGGCMGGFNGTPFTRLQTWWRYMPEFNGYIKRCEKFLEAGLPAQDVLWYLGDAVDHKPDEDYPFPEGFRADYLNHDVLTNRLSVKDGQFVVPEGTSWKVLWVPDERCMLSATRKCLAELAAAGGKVVFGGKGELVKALSSYAKDVATEPALGDEPSEDFMWIHRKG